MGNARCDVHRVDEAEPLPDSAFRQAGVDLRGDVQKPSTGGDLKPEFFTIGFHRGGSWQKNSVVGDAKLVFPGSPDHGCRATVLHAPPTAKENQEARESRRQGHPHGAVRRPAPPRNGNEVDPLSLPKPQVRKEIDDCPPSI